MYYVTIYSKSDRTKINETKRVQQLFKLCHNIYSRSFARAWMEDEVQEILKKRERQQKDEEDGGSTSVTKIRQTKRGTDVEQKAKS